MDSLCNKQNLRLYVFRARQVKNRFTSGRSNSRSKLCNFIDLPYSSQHFSIDRTRQSISVFSGREVIKLYRTAISSPFVDEIAAVKFISIIILASFPIKLEAPTIYCQSQARKVKLHHAAGAWFSDFSPSRSVPNGEVGKNQKLNEKRQIYCRFQNEK